MRVMARFPTRLHLPSALFILASALASVPAHAQATLVNVATDATDPFNLADTEPSIAVNPLNPLEVVIVAFSENWGPSAMAAVWRSVDRGATWTKTFQLPQPAPGLAGPRDQKVTFDAAGRLFIAELAGTRDYVFRQTGAPTDPLTPGIVFGDDQPHLAVDAVASSPCSGRLYVPWLSFATALQLSMVSTSTTGGVAMADVAAGNNATFSNRTTRIALGPNGRAYVIYKTREGASVPGFENAHFRVVRSDDCGVTWTGLGAGGVSVHGATAAETFFTTSFGNAAKGKVARARSSDAWIAVDPGDGDVYAAYVDRDASGFGQIYVARSIDEGATWVTQRITDGTHHSAFPEIAVAQNGTIGVLYVDYDDSGASTQFRHRFARSFNDGVSWSDQILQTMDPGPLANAVSGFLWGDYEGLTAAGNEFYGVFTGASTGRTTPQLDPIFFRETATSFVIAFCAAQPSLCPRPLRYVPNGLAIECVIRPCVVIDPVDQNCLRKFRCPGCTGGFCPPFYQFHIDRLEGAWDVALFDAQDNPVSYTEVRTRDGVVISFRPSERGFRPGRIGDYRLAFRLTDRGQLGRRYNPRIRLRRSDRPYRVADAGLGR